MEDSEKNRGMGSSNEKQYDHLSKQLEEKIIHTLQLVLFQKRKKEIEKTNKTGWQRPASSASPMGQNSQAVEEKSGIK